MEDIRFVEVSTLLETLGWSRTTLWRRIRDGKFPEPTSIRPMKWPEPVVRAHLLGPLAAIEPAPEPVRRVRSGRDLIG